MEKQIIFRLKSELFALPISHVERIINLNVTSSVPDLEDHIMGVTTYNENVLPVVNLAKRFFHEELESEEESQVLVTLWKNQRVGLAVDEVTEVRTIEKETLTLKQEEKSQQDPERMPEKNHSLKEQDEKVVQSVYAFVQTEQGILSLLDTDQLFNEKASEDIRYLMNLASTNEDEQD